MGMCITIYFEAFGPSLWPIKLFFFSLFVNCKAATTKDQRLKKKESKDLFSFIVFRTWSINMLFGQLVRAA